MMRTKTLPALHNWQRVASVIAAIAVLTLAGRALAETYPMVEVSFELPGIEGNPFDYMRNDIHIVLTCPDGRHETLPAFFDGGSTWRVRYTPRLRGKYVVETITRGGTQRGNGVGFVNAAPFPHEFIVSGPASSGFVRRSAAYPLQFELENGQRYYPFGNDVAWKSGPDADVPDFFARMGAAGENWARVWMCHWDDKNLDWPAPKAGGQGYLNLGAARRWDRIIEAAQKYGIRVQVTLQHHGQYSTRVDPNWNENPWNVKNGGFLSSPEAFFTDANARALTRAKYRYILARYGWSPNIMAWELFNEVEGTDAAREKQYTEIAAWHHDMAAFLRSQDPYHHLVTTSSDIGIKGLYDAVDYVQPHSYSPDPMAVIAGIHPAAFGKPIFLGEIGPSGNSPSDKEFLNHILWASIMSEGSGAAQYWFWDRMVKQDLFKTYAGVAAFLRTSHQLDWRELKSENLTVQTPDAGSFTFGPGGGWGTAQQTRFVVENSGSVAGAGSMPSFLQGNAHHEMFPTLELDVNYASAGQFIVTIGNVAKSGASVTISLDGKIIANKDFAAGTRDTTANTDVAIAVPRGQHRIALQNSGSDWLTLSRFKLTPYGSTLHGLARAGGSFASFWLNRTEGASPSHAAVGQFRIAGLRSGAYRVIWWDTHTSRVCGETGIHVGGAGIAEITTPPIAESMAGFLMISGL